MQDYCLFPPNKNSKRIIHLNSGDTILGRGQISLQCSRKQAILHLFPTPKKESLITQVMKDQQIIGKIVATGHTPIFIKTPCIDKEFRIIKKGEEASLYLNSQICLYIDSKEGVQIYSLLHDLSTKPTTTSIPTDHKSIHQSIETPSKKQVEEYNRFASITSNKTLQRLLSYCSKASQQLQQLSFTSIHNLPSSLHPHQQEGVSWLSALYNHGYNGILADEMGLGKTVQVLSFLNLLQQQQQYLKCIIIVPTSLLLNWEKEIKRWSSNLKYLMIKGTFEEKEECMKEYSMNRNEYSIILTSYSLFERDTTHSIRDILNHEYFDICILDEGHCIKNNTSKRYTRLMKLSCKHKYLLSGTPIQNTLHELFALLAFLHPSKATDLFSVVKELEKSNESQIITIVQQILQPFILRRVKQDVLQNLPKKTEIIERLEMKPFQQSLYEACITRYDKQYLSCKSEKEEGYDLIQLYMDLRKVANHPLLLRTIYTPSKLRKIHRIIEETMTIEELESMSDIEIHSLLLQHLSSKPSIASYLLTTTQLTSSCKIQYLLHLLPELLANHHRILIFSQWIIILDIIAMILIKKEIPFYRIDGQTQIEERQEQVDDFNTNTHVNVFLLTTRSGGLGLNLTGADTVIIYDSDYNPTFDKQAEDRCHRIGQTKEVTVYKCITKESVDEKIFEISQKKAKLGDNILDMQLDEKAFLQEVVKTDMNLIN